MSWSTPKTNWDGDTDRFNYTEFNRIVENVRYCFQRAYAKHYITQADYVDFGNALDDIKYSGYDEYWDAEDFNYLETFVSDIAYICGITFTPVTFAPNGQFITYTELNRIETTVDDCHTFLS